MFNHYDFNKLANKLNLTADELTEELESGNITIKELEEIAKYLKCCFCGWFIDKYKK